jgi:hypothetical protein
MTTEDEITKLKKRVTLLEQELERIAPLGNDQDRRLKILEDALLLRASSSIPARTENQATD